MSAPVSITEYYADKCVFVTGATGFVGKVFVEKVLRCCPRVRAIYCLVRPKKGASGAQRLHDMFKEKVSLIALT
jgi:fatty acyl-CoA reductase